MNVEFNVLRFTPDPEEVEPVNVALLFHGDHPEIVFEDDFPRLHCIAPNTDFDLVRLYLGASNRRLAEGARPDKVLMSMSSQFVVTPSKHLAVAPSQLINTMLREKYLRKPSAPRAVAAMAYREHVESQLDSLLLQRLRVPPRAMRKRVGPAEFLKPDTYNVLGANGIKFARAIRGPRSLMLIDGVTLGSRVGPKAELRAQTVAANFHRVGKIKSALERIEHRELVRATILFDKPQDSSARAEFIPVMLRDQCEYVEDGESPTSGFVHAVELAAHREGIEGA